MAEYIEREALRDKLLNISVDTSNLYNCGILEGLDRATKRLNEQPAADVTPVRHGRWMDVREKRLFGEHYFLCSNCKTRNGSMIPFNYCPNCGAKMEVKE